MLKKILSPFIKFLDHYIAPIDPLFINHKITNEKANLVATKTDFSNEECMIGLVCKKWTGSYFLIKIAQFLRSEGPKRFGNYTHAFVWFRDELGEPHILEALNNGIVKRSIFDAVLGKDKLLILNFKSIKLSEEFRKYILRVNFRDEEKNIEYDEEHDLSDDSYLDCAELIYHGLKRSIDFLEMPNKINTTKRAGVLSWTPLEAEECGLFTKYYEA